MPECNLSPNPRYRDIISLSNPNSGIKRASSAITQPPNSSSPVLDREDTNKGEKPLNRKFLITTGRGIVHLTAIRQAHIQILVERKPVNIKLKAALLIKTFPLNIFSGKRIYHNGDYMIRNNIFDTHNRKIAKLNIPARRFLLKVKGSLQSKASPIAINTLSYYRQLTHTSYKNIAYTAKYIKGIGNIKQPQIDPYNIYKLAKSIRFIPKTIQPQSNRALNRIHVDLYFFKPLISSKIQYLCLITDDKSCFKKGGTLLTKDSTLPFIRTTITQWHLQTRKIHYKTTPPRGHKQAGFYKQANRIILKKGRAIMNDLKPEDNKPDISHLQAIGTKYFINIKPEDREGILIGFNGQFIYKVYNPATKKIHRTSYVIFYKQSGHKHSNKIKRSRPKGAF
ncbi:hypothetical protein CEK27_003913 [Fusarium fujikuroi]|nr:hypothetical protein CEK27_003913 [Fusarium fujikuroi]QGI77145.1 hypothetical protein CEK25_003874 [Fusarium fujikuroi]